ncbi:cytochrome c oxidase subunit II [Rothia sp. AR01]|uniref:cytochrome-c oxidase n=1 Tax=Rothia santali TaxID=2949643 RepID=A0A9X2HD07_9MICC|nr:cytochrome c oxidase subunit II [Rothia santali]MCP3424607.1 cytochrome c oxidase subunit II [Rothia santali]
MSSQNRTGSRWVKGTAAIGSSAAVALLMTGCGDIAQRGFLPTERGTTNHVDTIMDLWIGSWIAALVVGLITWGLILWCIIAYRRRKEDTGYPRQMGYHLPLEILYTLIPIVLIVSLFSFSDRVEREIDARWDDPDVTVEVYGKQWAWDFNYLDSDVYSSGVQAHLTGEDGVEETLPEMYLPENSEVELVLKSRDVNHSFWIPAFLQKIDTIPGQTNYMSFETGGAGEYQGKCAELCGEYHSEMLFNVRVVPQAEYDAYMQQLSNEGNNGRLGDEYNRNPNMNETS